MGRVQRWVALEGSVRRHSGGGAEPVEFALTVESPEVFRVGPVAGVEVVSSGTEFWILRNGMAFFHRQAQSGSGFGPHLAHEVDQMVFPEPDFIERLPNDSRVLATDLPDGRVRFDLQLDGEPPSSITYDPHLAILTTRQSPNGEEWSLNVVETDRPSRPCRWDGPTSLTPTGTAFVTGSGHVDENGHLTLLNNFTNHIEVSIDLLVDFWENGPDWGAGTDAHTAALWGEAIAAQVLIRADLPDGRSRKFWLGEGPRPDGSEPWDPAFAR